MRDAMLERHDKLAHDPDYIAKQFEKLDFNEELERGGMARASPAALK